MKKIHKYHVYETTYHDCGEPPHAELILLDDDSRIVDAFQWGANVESFFFLNNKTFYPVHDKINRYTQL